MQSTSPPAWNPEALGNAVRGLRELGYSAAELADRAQISRPQISRWPTGQHRPGYDAVWSLARAVLSEHPETVYREVVRELCVAAGYPGIGMELGLTMPPSEVVEATSKHSGQVWRIIRTGERRVAQGDLDPEEEERILQAAFKRAEKLVADDVELAVYRAKHDPS